MFSHFSSPTFHASALLMLYFALLTLQKIAESFPNMTEAFVEIQCNFIVAHDSGNLNFNSRNHLEK